MRGVFKTVALLLSSSKDDFTLEDNLLQSL